MKKICCLFICSSLFLTSCSSDSSSENASADLLLKRVVEGDILFGGTTVDYTYNGNKLVEIEKSNDGNVWSDVYTYTGDVITKIEKFEVYDAGTPAEDTYLTSTDEFQYNGNNELVQFKTTTPDNPDMERVTTYTHSGNTVTFQQYENVTGEAPVLLKSGTITIQNGEISQVQVVKQFDSYTANYTYDTKNSIMKNVLGYDQILLTHVLGTQGSLTWLDTIVGGVSHNFVAGVTGGLAYTYNADNYPLTAEQSSFGSVLHSYEFEYY
jgi:hypothetical protein